MKPMFVDKHMERATYALVYTITDGSLNTSNPSNKVFFLGQHHGLELQQGFVSKKYRLRNPCTRQYLDLPDPCAGMIGKMKMSYIPYTREFKLVHSYVKENSYIIGCKILTAGTDAEWRSIDVPSPFQWSDFAVYNRVIDHICYMVFIPTKPHMDSCPNVACLDMQTEQFFLVDILWDFFLGWEHIMLLEWYGKLSIATYLEDEIHFWVLESYQTPKWSQRNIINGLKQSKMLGWLAGFLQGDNTNQVMVNLKEKEIISMHPSSGKTLMKVERKGYTFLYRREPSLIHIRGMQPERF